MKKYLIVVIIVSFFISCSMSKKMTDNNNRSWIDIVVIENMEVYVDTTSIEYKNDGYTYAWVKTTYTLPEARDAYCEKIRNSYPKQDKSVDKKMQKWNDFAYNISYRVYDCTNKKYKILEVTDYTSDNKKIITTSLPKNKQWHNIDTETTGDYTSYYICDYGN